MPEQMEWFGGADPGEGVLARLEDDYRRVHGQGLNARPWQEIASLMQQRLLGAYEIAFDGERVGSLGLLLVPAYEEERVRLEVAWLVVRKGEMTAEIFETVLAAIKAVAVRAGVRDVIIHGRKGWAQFARRVNAEEIARTWRVDVEFLS